MLMLNVPATFGLMVLATPIVRLLFERGRFLPADTARDRRRAALLRGRPGRLFRRADRVADLLRLGESRVPVARQRGAIAVNVVASLALVRAIGFRGLALGTSIAALVNAALLLGLLRRRLGGLDGRRLVDRRS